MKNIPLLSILAITIMAISISLLDFNDLSWAQNSKSYIGLVIFIVLLIVTIQLKRKKQ